MVKWYKTTQRTKRAEEMNYKSIFTPGLTNEEKIVLSEASVAAIRLAEQLGVDCSDVGFTFERDETGKLVSVFTVDGAEEISG